MTSDDGELALLIGRLRDSGVTGILQRLEPEDLLVADASLREALEDGLGAALPCRHITPAEIAGRKVPSAKRIYVFSLQGEWALVRSLRRDKPRTPIFSLQYDLMPAAAVRPVRPRLPAQPKADLLAPPVVILSSPGSDAEYLSDLMAAAGLGNVPEYMGEALTSLLPMMADRFHLPRLLYGAAMRQPEEGPFRILVQTDVLDALYASGALTPQRFVGWLQATRARVLYFVRRDKLVQAGFMGALATVGRRSIWRMPGGQRRKLMVGAADFAATNRLLNSLIEAEAALETLLEPCERVKMLTFEDLEARPDLVLEDIGQFLGQPARIEGELPGYKEVYRAVPDLLRHVLGFRLELIDRLGLHVNEAGSFVTESQNLFKGIKGPDQDDRREARKAARKEARKAARKAERAARKKDAGGQG